MCNVSLGEKWMGGGGRILQILHEFRVSYILINFDKAIYLLEISISSSMLCKIENVFNSSDLALEL